MTAGRDAIAIGLVAASIAVAAIEQRRPTEIRTVPFESSPCYPVPSDESRVTCGYLGVPERRDDPGSTTIQIAAAIVAPRTTPGTDVPVVFLAGGPGFGSLGNVESVLDGQLFEGRTVVLVDYRGVGLSEPSLACPEFDEFSLSSLGMDDDDPVLVQRTSAALAACHDRLVEDAIDLGSYNYTEISADLAALRMALGFDEWDLYGLSNGGRVALEVVRRHPEGIRSLVLDAASPPQGNLPGELWPNAQRAFDALFDGCAADSACAAAFPDLRDTFFGLVSELGASPVEVTVAEPDGTGDVVVRFTDVTALNTMRNALYDTTLIPLIPFFISELAAGRGYAEVAQLMVGESTGGRFSTGMALSVNCQEEIAFLPDGFFEDQAAQFPMLAPAILTNRSVDDCRLWDVGRADPLINQAVISDVPALVVVGEYDPVHPRTSSEQIAAGLAHSTVVEFPGLGHGVGLGHACPISIVETFLDDPSASVDTSCVALMTGPAWLLPSN